MDTSDTPIAQRAAADFGKPMQGWRKRLYVVIFEADTPAGKLFDVLLIAMVLLSVGVVIAHSLPGLPGPRDRAFRIAEWIFTLLFTVEYMARLACVERPLRYATSVFGIIDLLSVLPSYLAMLAPEAGVLIDVRILRLLRVFRVLRLTQYMAESSALVDALVASRRKILVFLSFVLMVVLISGTLMYVIEGPANGYTSIPIAMYWAVTTMTTVGFGDITPKSDIGRMLTSLMMLLGWGILAVPTGIVTAEMTARRPSVPPLRPCEQCGAGRHLADAAYCWNCGTKIGAAPPASRSAD